MSKSNSTKLLEVTEIRSTRMEVEITLSNGIKLSVNANRDSLYLHFSGLGRDGLIAVSPTGRDDDPQKLDLSNYVHVHLPHKET